MGEWERLVQVIVEEVDECIKKQNDEYRNNPVPVVLRTVIKPFDCYLVNIGGTSMANTENDVKIYFVTIPAHKYLHIRNYESNGYWDFWEKHPNGFGNLSGRLKSCKKGRVIKIFIIAKCRVIFRLLNVSNK